MSATWFRWLGVGVLLTACGTGASSGTGNDASTSLTCMSSRQCSALGQVCDVARGKCVECLSVADCTGNQQCIGGRCLAPTPCTSSRMCAGFVCDPVQQLCVECVSSLDCPSGEQCEAQRCVPGSGPARDAGTSGPEASVEMDAAVFPDVPVVVPDVVQPDIVVQDTGTQCSAQRTCDGCARLPNCGFCAESGRCLAGTELGPTGSSCANWRWTTFDCVDDAGSAPEASVPDVVVPDVVVPDTVVVSDVVDRCVMQATCGGCTALGECGFCRDTGRCVQGTSSGPRSGTCSSWAWVASHCNPDAGVRDVSTPDVPAVDVVSPDVPPMDECRAFDNTCIACAGSCGYCASTGQCVPGSATGPSSGTCALWVGSIYRCEDYNLASRCLRCYPDADGDGYPGSTMSSCEPTGVCPAGSMRRRTDGMFDCADTDMRARPGQTQYFETPVMGTANSFDYNCDGIQGMRYPTSLVFCSASGGTCTNNGWRNGGVIPPCGMSGTFGQCGGSGCTPQLSTRIQACR